MTLTTATIKSKLTAAGWTATDDVARSIVNGASAADLKSLDIEAVLRLYLEMSSGWLSAEDKAALDDRHHLDGRYWVEHILFCALRSEA